MQVTITKFTSKGYGQGLLPNGKEVEVPHAVVGDQLEIEWKKKKRPPQKGRILSVLTPSSKRISPPCPHVQICGGCCWQQMDYAAQLEEKQSRVKKAFKNFPVDPILPCDSPFGYRNKMEFTFSQNRGGMKYLGLMIAAAEPYVFNLTECHLGPSWYAEILQAIRQWWESSSLQAYYPPEDTGSLRYVTMRHGFHTQEKMVILNVSGREEFAPTAVQLEAFVQAVTHKAGTVSIFLRKHVANQGRPTQFSETHLYGPPSISEKLYLKGGTLDLQISPASFFQPNTLQAEKLYNVALSTLPKDSVVYDLYCGTGTLSLAAAFFASKVIGIELVCEAVADAQKNAIRNGLNNVSFWPGDVAKVLQEKRHLPDFIPPDVVIVDPPRAGLEGALCHLKTLLPRQIIYISCNIATQASDIEELLKEGYRLIRLQPVDQFPHTYHIENIAFLER